MASPGLHRRHPAVEVDRRHDRLKHVGEHRIGYWPGNRQPLAHDQKVGEAQLAAQPAAGFAAHDDRFDPREIPLERFRERVKEPLADDESQDGIAEKLKPLVRGQTVLGARGMGDRRHEEVGIAKRVTDPPLAFPHVDARPGRGPELVSAHGGKSTSCAEKTTPQPHGLSTRRSPRRGRRTGAALRP